jgi:hypothetical protein
MKLWKRIFFVVLLVSSISLAQEFDCEVTMNVDQLTAEGRENLSDFVQQVKQYLNNYRWTSEDFGDEKIKCNFDIQILGSPRSNHFVAKVFIGSLRPIKKQNQNTAVVRILDENWEFDYVRNQSLIHESFLFDPLVSFLDYYAYILLGYDFDTWNAGGGTPYFQKALTIVNRARGSSGGKGWEPTAQASYSRGQLVEELLNPKFQDFREAFAKYHFKGLDLLYKNPLKAKDNISAALETISKLQEKLNTRALIIKLFFETKYLELAQTFLDYPKAEIYDFLSTIDPSHQKTYREYKQKR